MGQERVTFACGHIKTVQLDGPARRRESRAEWLGQSECWACRTKQREREQAEKNERHAAENRAAGLPELSGSPKQVAWAETIRGEMIEALRADQDRFERLLGDEISREREDVRRNRQRHLERIATVLAALTEVDTARWFIDHRDEGVTGLTSLAARGQLAPRTAEQFRAGFDPFGLNELVFPAEEVAGRTKDGRWGRVRLVCSRWEGCTVLHQVSMTREAPDGSVTVRFRGGWDIRISDGARTHRVSAEEFYFDRTQRRESRGERHYWGMPAYEPGEWNEFDVPEGDVTEQQVKGQQMAVVRLVCSRWEGLHVEHPVGLVRRHRPGFVTLRFPPAWQFKVLGGEKMLRIDGQLLHKDRAEPLPEPGESLAVEQKTWHTVTFHPSRVRRGRDAWWVRLTPESAWPEAAVFHSERMCRRDEDGYVTWRFHDAWEFRIRTPDGGTVDATAEEFLKAVEDWAGTPPRPGAYTREPEDLAAVEDVDIPAELLDEDPLARVEAT